MAESIESENLELKVFAFSVDVISFVKSLEKSGKINSVFKNLLKVVNEFYSNYLDAEEALDEYDKSRFLEESKVNAEKCLELLQSIEVSNEFLNERVDLIIEVAELIKKIPSRKV